MRILGIDPGLARIGLGLIETSSSNDILSSEWLVLETSPRQAFGERLLEIHRDLSDFISREKPDLAVVEKLFFAKNQTTALDVSHARGCILLCLAELGVPFIEPTPLQLKLGITGDGRADKSQVQEMIMQMLNLSSVPSPDDAADALALAAYGALSHKSILLTACDDLAVLDIP